MIDEVPPAVPHIAAEFLIWLWYRTDGDTCLFDVDGYESVIVWLDDRMAFSHWADHRIAAIFKGESPAMSPESIAALSGGKRLVEIRIGMRVDDREYMATLKGPTLDVVGMRLPTILAEDDKQVIWDRMLLYDEFMSVLGGIFCKFCAIRADADAWHDEQMALRRWAHER